MLCTHFTGGEFGHKSFGGLTSLKPAQNMSLHTGNTNEYSKTPHRRQEQPQRSQSEGREQGQRKSILEGAPEKANNDTDNKITKSHLSTPPPLAQGHCEGILCVRLSHNIFVQVLNQCLRRTTLLPQLRECRGPL